VVYKSGQSYRLTPKILKDTVKAFADNGGNVSRTAKQLDLTPRTLRHRLEKAEKAGLMEPRNATPVPARWRPGAEIVAARKAEFERVKSASPSRLSVIHRPDNGPFVIVLLGDEHLDSPGTSLELFEHWIGYLDRSKHITGWSLGDMLDNWAKPLAHLYGASETPAPEGWILLQHYMDQIGDHLDASIGGNHDKWSGSSDLLAMIMNEHGVLHRNDSLRVAYRCPNGREVTIHARHSWPGRSMWNEVHALKRAARMGVRDTILAGGHTHVSGDSTERDPMTGRMTFCYQVASFKIIDDYADTLGFLDRHISPAVALVIDPRREDTDPELVKHFYDPAFAAEYLAFLRRKPKARPTSA